MRIYDAREDGGFFKLPAAVPCQASDECHGPEQPAARPRRHQELRQDHLGNVLVCPKNRVKKHGKCVKKPTRRSRHAQEEASAKNGKRGGRDA